LEEVVSVGLHVRRESLLGSDDCTARYIICAKMALKNSIVDLDVAIVLVLKNLHYLVRRSNITS
jgi:hypothetical protein